jgi:hypothetical protein
MPTLIAIRYYTESTPVLATRDNEPLQDLSTNINTVNAAVDGLTTSFNTLNTDYTTHHKGLGADPNGTPLAGITHQNATATTSGFMSSSQYTKLSLIQDNAQVNALALVEALELVSRGSTTLHRHRNADSNAPDPTPAGVYHDGFMSASQAARLASIAFGAQPQDPEYVAAKPAILHGTTPVGGLYPADAYHKHANQLTVGTPTPSPPPSFSNITSLNIIGAGGLGVGIVSPSPGQANVTLTQAAGPTPTPTPGPTPLPTQDHSYQPVAHFFSVANISGTGTISVPSNFTPIAAWGQTSDNNGFVSQGFTEAGATTPQQGAQVTGNSNAQLSGHFGFGNFGNQLTVTAFTSSGLAYSVNTGAFWITGIMLGYTTAVITFP